MEQQPISPTLDSVIAKIKSQEALTVEEEIVYLVSLGNIPEADARQLVKHWSEKKQNNNRNQQKQ